MFLKYTLALLIGFSPIIFDKLKERYKKYIFFKERVFVGDVKKSKSTEYVKNIPFLLLDKELLINFYKYHLYNFYEINFVDEFGKSLVCYERDDKYSQFFNKKTFNINYKI